MLKAFFVAASEDEQNRTPLNSPIAVLTSNQKREPEPEEGMEPLAVNCYKLDVLFASGLGYVNLSQRVESYV